MTKSVDGLIEFVEFTHDIQRVNRAMYVRGENFFENDSEHSYQLAMAALYVIEHDKLPLDVYHAIALALVHDVIEVHSGDTPVYGTSTVLASKAERETQAVQKLKEQWPQLALMHELIEECEAKATAESKFIYALDKLLPILNNYLDKGRSWLRQKVSFDQMRNVKAGKVDVDPTIAKYYQETLELLRQHPELFIN